MKIGLGFCVLLVVVLAAVTILAIGVYPEPFAHLPTLSTLVGR